MNFLLHKHERRKCIASGSQVILKELNFPGDLNFAAPLTHEFLRFQGDLILLIGKFQNFKKHLGRRNWSLMVISLTLLQ